MKNHLLEKTSSPNFSREIMGPLFIILISLVVHLICMKSANLLVEEAYYWNYAQHLDFSYLDHPPMVAVLIKLSTFLFGTHELSVRFPSLICFMLTCFFSYKLTALIDNRAGIYAIMLLAVLPFFFLQSLVITPDLPLLACWSASIYCLYRALVLNEASYWYLAGVALGLGMLSKYTVVLIGLAVLTYLVSIPEARAWFKRKEPYLCALIVALFFTPVLYWNASHEWISFIFQSTRRFQSLSTIDLPYLLLLCLIFLTPYGLIQFAELFKIKKFSLQFPKRAQQFILTFTLVPLVFFAVFSLNHQINFNWIGPIFLTLIPWFAVLIANYSKRKTIWLSTACILLLIYSSILLISHFNTSTKIQEKIFIKLILWENLIKQFNELAEQIELKTQKKPIFIPLDNFPIASELSFYQSKLLKQGKIQKSYPVVGAHIFGMDSLMYYYWSEKLVNSDTPLILISKELWRFSMPQITYLAAEPNQLNKIWSYGQGQRVKNIPYYYKVIQLKENFKAT